MTRMVCRLIACAVLTAGASLGAQSNTEEFARRQYESGLAFFRNRQYAEALKDFQSVVDSFPNSAVADNALLQIASYQLDVSHDLAATQATVDTLLKRYPDTDSAPMAHVVAGRLALTKGHTPSDVDRALASFERVPRLFPGHEAVPAAGFYTGETLRLVRRTDDALERLRRVAMEYPRSIWAARASLAASLCLVQTDRAPQALEELQRTRQQFPGSVEAVDALNWNTILYRLHVRAPAQTPFAFSGRYVGSEAAKFRDVVGVTSDGTGRLFLGHKTGVAVFDSKSALIKTVSADEPSAFMVDELGRVVAARRDTLVIEGGAALPITARASDGKPRAVEEIRSVAGLSTGDRLIIDGKNKAIIRVSPAGEYVGPFLTVNAERLAINRYDDVAILDRESKGLTITDRDGKPLAKVPPKGQGYEFNNPVDLTYDALGHLYVLDRGRASVFVFGTKHQLIATFTIAEKSAGAFSRAQAFALDAAGRLYIFDERAQRIQVYQ